ncbi:MAG: hypothetical protein AAGA55_12665 [Planctomycetota bacterium]
MRGAVVAVAVLVGSAGSASANVEGGQIDTFESDVAGWSNTFGAPTTSWTASGGPGGAADAYMTIETNGSPSGPGSRLGAWNGIQWSGDYVGQGITQIRIDIAGFEGPGAELRLQFLSNVGSQFTSLNSVFVPTDSVWRTYTFDISENGMFQTGGASDYADSFADVTRMHLRHQPGAPGGFGSPPAYDGRIGIDNVRAVPGPAGLGVLSSGLLAGFWRGRRAGRRA